MKYLGFYFYEELHPNISKVEPINHPPTSPRPNPSRKALKQSIIGNPPEDWTRKNFISQNTSCANNPSYPVEIESMVPINRQKIVDLQDLRV